MIPAFKFDFEPKDWRSDDNVICGRADYSGFEKVKAAGNIREACRTHNVTEQTFSRWRNKYGGITT